MSESLNIELPGESKTVDIREFVKFYFFKKSDQLHTNINPSLAEHDMHCLSKQCRSRSVGFFRSQLTWIYTVCH